MSTHRILSLIVPLFLLAGTSPALADALPKGLAEKLHFAGRWDLRKPDRAVTVNSGSYVLARFEGTGVAARFDLAANKPRCRRSPGGSTKASGKMPRRRPR